MEIVPFAAQQQVLNSTAKYIAAIAGIQGGKTQSGSIWTLKEIINNPKEDYLIAAPTYKILEQSTLKKFFEIFPMRAGVYRKQDSVIKLHGGGNIFIRSTEIPNTIEGMTLRAAWLDEAGMMKSQIWTNIQGRIAIKKGRVLMTSTPYNMGWLYNDVVRQFQAGNPDYDVVKWKSIDNPWFPKEEYERAKKTMHPAEFERRYNGEFRKMEGLVYPDWDAEAMLTQELPDLSQLKEIWAGVDYGYTNPAAIIVVGLTKDNKLYILDEVYSSKLTINDIVNEARSLKEKWGVQYFYVDPSAPSLIESLNLNGMAAMAANNDVDPGITKVRQIISKGRLKVWAGSYNFIDEVELYHYNPSTYNEQNPEFKIKPFKEHDHAMDAFRYAIATHPLEIFDVLLETVEDKRTEFWKNVEKRMTRRRINIERYGEDFPDQDIEILDSVYI